MKLNIVQAVKLGTVACLLAVTTQTIGKSMVENKASIVYPPPNHQIAPQYDCKDRTMTVYEIKESKVDTDGHQVTKTYKGRCGTGGTAGQQVGNACTKKKCLTMDVETTCCLKYNKN